MIRLAPPLVLTDRDVDHFLDVLPLALDAASSALAESVPGPVHR